MISIVLGAMFGDEGKGSVVNHLVRESKAAGRKPVVVRFSGGPQAGHTVVQNGIRHVFSNVGSGALSGADTIWSKYCLFEPGAFMKEIDTLAKKGIYPVVHIDNECQVITPYDRWSNQLDGSNLSHGSCGQGIGKTMNRIEKTPLRLSVGDLYAPTWVLNHKLEQIEKYYFSHNTPDHLKHEVALFKTFIMIFKERFPDGDYASQAYDDYIFEGSQGILLDRTIGLFPHVTYADTTAKNAWSLIKEWDLKKSVIETLYVTRCYLTRHGNGPMCSSSNFEEKLFLVNNENETNVLNPYQGEFRTAPFDLKLFQWAIHQNDVLYGDEIQVVTCMDQIPDRIPMRMGEFSTYLAKKEEFKELFPEGTLFSYGPEFKLE